MPGSVEQEKREPKAGARVEQVAGFTLGVLAATGRQQHQLQ